MGDADGQLRTRGALTVHAIKPVIQEELTGCGIAAVATLASVSYEQARRVANGMGIFAEDPKLWSQTNHVRALLRHFGVGASARERPFRSWKSLPAAALLATKWHLERGQPFWHWSVFWRGPDGDVVLDSRKALRRHVRTDFWRIRPKWFIEVRLPSEP